MNIKTKIVLIALFLIAGTGIIISGLLSGSFTQEGASPQPIDTVITRTISGVYLGTFGNITFSAPMPESPTSLTVYTGVLGPADLIDISPNPSIGEGVNVTSEKDAPAVAAKILEGYGGLPPDAIFMGATTENAELLNRTTLQVEETLTIDTSVSWQRLLDGRDIEGDSDIIRVLLGDDGKPTWIYKRWRTYTPSGDVPIIPVQKAISKLEKGDTINQYLTTKEDVNIYNISLGYYAKGLEKPIITLEPVWIFYGDTSSGSGVSFMVYARQFANFTSSPPTGKVPLKVTFNDTSDASPVKWYWDFGDGTNSTEQNPVHTFTNAGTFNISLKAWNDLGSDLMEKPAYITARNPAAPVANFTGTPATILSVKFNDTSSGELGSVTSVPLDQFSKPVSGEEGLQSRFTSRCVIATSGCRA